MARVHPVTVTDIINVSLRTVYKHCLKINIAFYFITAIINICDGKTAALIPMVQ